LVELQTPKTTILSGDDDVGVDERVTPLKWYQLRSNMGSSTMPCVKGFMMKISSLLRPVDVTTQLLLEDRKMCP
jgi:hypothetical protein